MGRQVQSVLAVGMSLLFSPAETAADASCTADGWCPAFSLAGTDSRLVSIWGSSTGDVFVVGGESNLHGSWPLGPAVIVRFDGERWIQQDSGFNGELMGVAGSGPNEVYAVGGFRGVLRWDGRQWRQEHAEMAHSHRWAFFAVAVPRAGQAFAFIDDGSAYARGQNAAWERARTLYRGSAPFWQLIGDAPPEGLPPSCFVPRFERLNGRWFASCERGHGIRAFEWADASRGWRGLGRSRSCGGLDLALVSNRWFRWCGGQLYVRDAGDSSDTRWRTAGWTASEGPAAVGPFLRLEDGTFLVGDRAGNLHRFNGAVWSTELTGAGVPLTALWSGGGMTVAAARNRILVKRSIALSESIGRRRAFPPK